jgi:hypothetical protein
VRGVLADRGRTTGGRDVEQVDDVVLDTDEHDEACDEDGGQLELRSESKQAMLDELGAVP